MNIGKTLGVHRVEPVTNPVPDKRKPVEPSKEQKPVPTPAGSKPTTAA
jgi:hypothetical protein